MLTGELQGKGLRGGNVRILRRIKKGEDKNNCEGRVEEVSKGVKKGETVQSIG